jgi:hypothetical protein
MREHRTGKPIALEIGTPRRVSGTQIHPSCCSGVFVNQSSESVASVEPVLRAWTDEA